VAWAEVYFRTKWRLHPSSLLVTIDMGQKLGGCRCSLFLGVTGFPSNTKSPGPRPTSISSGILVHPAVCNNRHWPKIGGLCPFRGGEAGSPSNTMSNRPRPTSISSDILINAAISSQQTWAENWGLRHFLGRRLGPHLTQSRVGRGLPPYQAAS